LLIPVYYLVQGANAEEPARHVLEVTPAPQQ
jgi:hypothetical protein